MILWTGWSVKWNEPFVQASSSSILAVVTDSSPCLVEPVLAPITTGLGEIYQHVLQTKKGYENKYTATDLRTLQDWLVRTQLAGTVGVAEVSGWAASEAIRDRFG
ncbi:MAG: hypothetical protein ACXVJD_10500 [Mucilaginibacter sp.]